MHPAYCLPLVAPKLRKYIVTVWDKEIEVEALSVQDAMQKALKIIRVSDSDPFRSEREGMMLQVYRPLT